VVIIAYKAYQRFLVEKAKERQLDIVLSLISEIHNSKNKYSIPVGAGKIVESLNDFSVFDFASINNDSLSGTPGKKDALYFGYVNWNFYKEYHSNPLIPTEIAACLSKLKLRTNFTSMDKSTPYVHVGNSMNYYGRCVELDCRQHTTFGQFQNDCQELKRSIVKWLESYGITDINLIESA
jgi:hypothetical protein